MPVQSNADNNVPWIGPRARYNILCNTPTWVYQKMTTGKSFNGADPRTATVAAADFDPVVTAGKAMYDNLTEGGFFRLLGNYKRPMVVEALNNEAGATIEITNSAGTKLRDTPSATPFKVAPGEYIKANGGTAAKQVGLLVRIDGEKIW
jgi:hypothetical protein